MALKSKITKLEDVAESLRAEYTKGDDGAFYLNVESPDDLPAVRGLRKNRDDLRTEKEALAAKYAGVDIDSLKAEIATLKEGNKGGRNDAEISALTSQLKQLKDAAAAEKTTLEKDRDSARAEKDNYIRKAEIRGVLNKHDGNPIFLEHLLEGQLKVVDGKAVVVDSSGNPRIKNSLNEPLTLDDLVLDLKAKPEFGGAFKAPSTNGSGAGAGNGSGAKPGTVKAGSKEYFANLDKVASGELKIAE